MSVVTLAREPIDGLLDAGLEALLLDHWREVAHDQGAIKLEPDWEFYRIAEVRDQFAGFGLRRGTELIGYTGFFLAYHPHYKSHRFANNDVIYLKPGERGIEGLAMILQSEVWLRERGISKVFYHTKIDAILGSPSGDSLEAIDDILELEDRLGTNLHGIDVSHLQESGADRTLGAVLKALGYKRAEVNYGKLLIEE